MPRQAAMTTLENVNYILHLVAQGGNACPWGVVGPRFYLVLVKEREVATCPFQGRKKIILMLPSGNMPSLGFL